MSITTKQLMRTTAVSRSVLGLISGVVFILIAGLLYFSLIQPALRANAIGDLPVTLDALLRAVYPIPHNYATVSGSDTQFVETPETHSCACHLSHGWTVLGDDFMLPIFSRDLLPEPVSSRAVWRGVIREATIEEVAEWQMLAAQHNRRDLRPVPFILEIREVNGLEFPVVIGLAMALGIGLGSLVPFVQAFSGVSRHPQYKSLGRFGAPIPNVMAAADRELGGETEKIGDLRLTHNLLIVTGSEFSIVPRKDVIWIYPQVPLFGDRSDPAKSMTAVVIMDRHKHKTTLKGRRRVLVQALDKLAAAEPWAYVGGGPETAKVWRENPDKMIGVVDRWRKAANDDPFEDRERPRFVGDPLNLNKRDLASSVRRTIYTSSAVQMLLGLLCLATFFVFFVTESFPYFEAKAGEPTQVTLEGINAGAYELPTHFARVNAPSAYDSGIYYETTRYGITTSKDHYGLLQVGDKFLLVITSAPITENRADWLGTLRAATTAESREVINAVIADVPALAGAVVNYVLDTGEADSTWWFVGLVLLALVLALGVYVVLRSLRYFLDPNSHPTWRQLTRYGSDVPVTLNAITRDLKAHGRTLGTVSLGAQWFVRPGLKYSVMRLEDVVWLYKNVITQKKYGITINTIYSAMFFDKYGTEINVTASETVVNELLISVHERAPWAATTMTTELQRTWKRERQYFLDSIEARRRSWTTDNS